METQQRDEVIAALGLDYSAEFVPQSKSRNAKEKDLTLNWRVTLKRGGVELTTDYQQGIGHMPNYNFNARRTLEVAERERLAAEKGKYYTGVNNFASKHIPLPAPPLVDILYSLALDSDALDYTFEDWCGNFGYDTDSRTAEKLYRTCLDLAIKFRQLVGDEGMKQLREALQDY